MASTRFNYDHDRTVKLLEESTFAGRYMLDTPGLGENPAFILDPYIVPQKWGGNLYSNVTDMESSLWGVNKPLQKDCLHHAEFTRYIPQNSAPMYYPTNSQNITEQPRAIMPAWTARELEQSRWQYLPFDPQENVALNFHNNWNTRMIFKDNFQVHPVCMIYPNNDQNHQIPPQHSNATHASQKR